VVKDNGGPAFPFPAHYDSLGQPVHDSHCGMTLRDYFAAAALPEVMRHWRTLTEAQKDAFSYAEFAYDAADAMLKERDK